jgi:hypothetical protein
MSVFDPSAYFFYCKTEDWRGEEEVRVVVLHGGGKNVRIEPSWLTRIILGMNISLEHEQQIRGWARQRMPELAVVKAHYDAFPQKLILR